MNTIIAANAVSSRAPVMIDDRALATISGGTILDDLPTSLSIDLGEGAAVEGAEVGGEVGSIAGPLGVAAGLVVGGAVGWLASKLF